MQGTTLAQRIALDALKTTPRPQNPVETINLLRRLPRNRLEARRMIATRGRVARV